MNLPVNKTSAEYQNVNRPYKTKEEGIVSRWMVYWTTRTGFVEGRLGPQSYPDLSQIHVENYFRTSKFKNACFLTSDLRTKYNFGSNFNA
jgi:hypothetical protein